MNLFTKPAAIINVCCFVNPATYDCGFHFLSATGTGFYVSLPPVGEPVDIVIEVPLLLGPPKQNVQWKTFWTERQHYIPKDDSVNV